MEQVYLSKYHSPLGEITLLGYENRLATLIFSDQKTFKIPKNVRQKELKIFSKVKSWLDKYFAAQNPQIDFELELYGTDFQKQVWEILKTIPYGKSITYGEIAQIIAQQRNLPKMSAQAVGHAVSSNPISIIIPCHRVLGKTGNLTGYAGGLNRKRALLNIEKIKFNDCTTLKR